MASRGLSHREIENILELNDTDSMIDGFSDDDDLIFAPSIEEEPREESKESSDNYCSEDEVPLSTIAQISQREDPSQLAQGSSPTPRRVYWKHEENFAPTPPAVYCQSRSRCSFERK
ncbi:uncharacterized protein LOC132903449 [Amyelois transitella]|uniref:uncharacterized protein LOC132903449 n=1 Tax=Amyelois transitella TaxID=680683 RepID=UPI0029903C1D|nr:uncharacterized protein LOC132903449 [Amyelois transitella]